MPTPFMHLQVAEAMRQNVLAEMSDPAVFWAQDRNWPAFYLGGVAPDYQTICGIPRADTHFYEMPPQSREQGVLNMLAAYPQLNPGQMLEADRAAFVGAYLSHLHLDLKWHFDVVLPYFVDSPIFINPGEAYLLHLSLLTHLDRLALLSLPESAPQTLAAADPNGWLPFAGERCLQNWQVFLVEQLQPGADVKTVDIFARRMGMTAQEFAAKLNDQDWMKHNLYARLPVPEIEQLMRRSAVECLSLLEDYWLGRLA